MNQSKGNSAAGNAFTKEAAVAAIEENLFAYIRTCADIPANDFVENEKGLWFSTGFKAPSMLSACVYNFQGGKGDLLDEVKEQMQVFRERKVPVLWTTGPSSPPQLESLLKKAGMMHVQSQAGMAMDLSRLEDISSPPAGVELREVGNREELLQFMEVFNAGFEQAPALNRLLCQRYEEVFLNEDLPMGHYLALYRGRPAATASYFSADGVTGIYNIVTAPEARRRGLAEFMTRHVLLEGKKRGDSMGILQATPAGEPVYRRIGFQSFCELDMFIKMYGSSLVTIPLNLLRVKTSNMMRKIFR